MTLHPPAYKDIFFTLENDIAIITIDRPEKLNAIRIQTYHDIIDALKKADASSDCKCIVITGSNNTFTAGNDLTDLVGDRAKDLMAAVQAIFGAVSGLKKPLIAAVEGIAVGIGTTILLHCDLVVASDKTRFRLPFVNLGVSPEGGSSVLLPQAIGLKAANELLLTGRFFTAKEAFSWGLINKITHQGGPLNAAIEYASIIADQPLEAVLATKNILRKNNSVNIPETIAGELDIFLELAQSKKTQERIKKIIRS